jgi:hypothetical protein
MIVFIYILPIKTNLEISWHKPYGVLERTQNEVEENIYLLNN